MTHPIYTEIQQRSYDALVRSGTLEEVLLALITDPLAAEDVADELEAKTRKLPALHPNAFAELGANVIAAWKITIAQWAMTQADVLSALLSLVTYDRRLGVWCTCQVVRDALRFVPASERRPRVAIETTEAWVMGRASTKQVSQSATAAYAVPIPASFAAAYAAYAASGQRQDDVCFSVRTAADAAAHAAANSSAAVAAARASNTATEPYASAAVWGAEMNAELIRLQKVVAAACFTFPVEAMR